MIRIVYVITSTTFGGAERKLHSIITGLDKSRFTVAGVISLKPLGPIAGIIAESGIPVSSLNMGYIPSPFDIGRLAEEIKKFNPDIVNAFLFRAIQFSRMAKSHKKLNFRLVSSTEVNYRSRNLLLRWIDKFFLTKDELTVCESQASADFMTESMNYNKKKTAVIKNGTDPAHWIFSAKEREETRNRLDIKKDELLILTVGRLSRQKGHIYLIDALASIKKPHNIKCAVIGTGPYKELLERRIHSKGLKGRVMLAGAKDCIKPWLCAADIFILPSLWEGIPIALLEAMALGLPCIATSVDGVREVIDEGQNGLTCPPANPEELAQAVIRLCEDVPLRNSLALSAKKTIRDNFSTQLMVKNYEQVYLETLNGRG